MADGTNIEWTDATWNPIVGCSIVSPGCTNCYAMSMAARIDKMTLSSHYEGLTHKVNGHNVWTGKVALANEYIFTAPMRWRKPKRVFVNSMGDLFHEAIPDEWIDRVVSQMIGAKRHQFQVLTKRAARMHNYLASFKPDGQGWTTRGGIDGYQAKAVASDENWPPRNIWWGVSAERQQEADERIPLLLDTPAAVRFVSLEPLLGPIDLHEVIPDPLAYTFAHGFNGLDWVIVGGESGPNARRMDARWARNIRDQCVQAGVPFFFKQWGQHDPETFDRVGKKASGRLLDGVEHSAFPAR